MNKKNPIFLSVQNELKSCGFKIISKDFNRPWGGFFVISEFQAQLFSDKFFNGLNIENLKIGGKLSPKILIVKPRKRLSWQYHKRRAEIWQIYKGTAGIIKSDTDIENEIKLYKEGEQIILKQRERHRLIGQNSHCVVAEIWRHTNKESPSDEHDIVRIQDDFGR